MQKVAKVLFTKISVCSLILSAIFSWILVPVPYGFPMVPFFILFVCLSTLVYIVKTNRSFFDTVLYFGILVLSSFLLIRADDTMQFINFIFIIILGSLLTLPIYRESTLVNLLVTPFSLITIAIVEKNNFPYSLGGLKKFDKIISIKRYLPSVLITIIFLIITIPLLSSANPFFERLVQDVLKLFNLTELLNFIFVDEPFLYFIRFIFFIILVFLIPRILSVVRSDTKTRGINFSLPVNYLFPKIAMSALLIVFFITQAQLYFASFDTLQSMGYTNSRLTNEVFFQVTVVAFVIFFLAYLDRGQKFWNKILSYFLILEAFFLVGIAFKSVFDYSLLWGFTQKRLWGYATMIWLTGALLIFLYYYIKKLPLFRFFQITIIFTMISLIIINLANFDYLISHNSSPRTLAGTDFAYLARLSTDSSYYKETLNNLVSQVETSGVRESEKITSSLDLLRKIDNLQKKYEKGNLINSFNLSEYNEYHDIKDIDTNVYYLKLSGIEEKFKQQEMLNSKQQSLQEETR